MSWIIAETQPTIRKRLYVAEDAERRPCWTDAESLAHPFDTQSAAETYAEHVDLGQDLEVVSTEEVLAG